MHYLITGGAGFVGSHLADLLLANGHRVTVIDNLSTGSIRNIAHLRDHKRFRYVIEDMNELRVLAELVDDADAVFHLAAAVGVELIVRDPVRTMETNISCTDNLLKIARKKHRKVLVASTSEVYGKSPHVPFREDADMVFGPTIKQRWAYAASKAVDEFMALAYYKQYDLPTVIVRLFNTVGPRQTGQYGMVIPRLVSQALEGEPLTVYGDGGQSRCFTHVRDVVGALSKLMELDAANGQIFNVGSQQEVTILTLAERIRAITESDSAVTFVPYDEAYEHGFEDMRRRVPDLTKIRGAIGYEARLSLDQILQDIVAEKRENAAIA